jgi:hypothetical protein
MSVFGIAAARSSVEARTDGTRRPAGAVRGSGRRATVTLWVIQGLLALLFLFAGGAKLILPLAILTAQFPLPGLFVRGLGVCELLGAVGLILPGALHIRPGLTPLAAAGLVIVMVGATTLTVASGQVLPALFPLIVGLLAVSVVYGRRSALRS